MAAVADVPRVKPYRKNRLVPAQEPRAPEPILLYSLIGLALVLHGPVAEDGTCAQCAAPWPCGQARLAYRLREGF